MKDKNTVYIIGAGVSGLVAAYELEKAGFNPTVIEQTSEVGGRVKTVFENGHPFDLGFQVLLTAYPLAKKYLNMEDLELKILESGALIYAEDRAYRIGDPIRNWKILFPTLFSNIGSLGDKLKILRLNKKLKRKSIEEIFESPETSTHKYLLELGFSNKIIERFFRPFFAGIFLEPNLETSSRMFEFVYKMFGEGYAAIPKFGIGEISKQLEKKLKRTEFIFNCKIQEVTPHHIVTADGDKKTHNGVIIASNSNSLIQSEIDQIKNWKSCMCLYFEVDQTNIPENTIALISDPGNYANNLFAYKDHYTGKLILSVTTLKYKKKEDEELIQRITQEIRKYTKAKSITHLHHYKIDKALPDIRNLQMIRKNEDIQADENIFLAGDFLLNGSLNAAMESGQLAVKSLLKNKTNL